MRACVVQHIAVEGPGTLAPFLTQGGWQFETIALHDGAAVPTQPENFQAIIVMGGPMGVYDEAAYPFLRAEHHFLQEAIAAEVPILGICLGSQLLAKALGARVYRNPHKEIGWYTVDLTSEGRCDPLFAGVTTPLRVFQWHGDAFELPDGATPLATSALCPLQAFRYGAGVYGLLFHLELTPAIIHSWLNAFQEELCAVPGQIDAAQIMAAMPHYLTAYQHTRTQVFTNLLRCFQPPQRVV
jgi:GMP synthase-like glutamine amidotransferase